MGIESIGINPSIPLMATGSTDCNIKIWSACKFPNFFIISKNFFKNVCYFEGLVEPNYDEDDEEETESSSKKFKISNSEIRVIAWIL